MSTRIAPRLGYVSPNWPLTSGDPGINLPAILGSSTAYVGFTASTAGDGAADQYFSSVQFTAIPEPATALLLTFAAAIVRRRRSSCSKQRKLYP
ncbi:MAG: hypothetical protein DCC66_02915 [Planctomycetota bacterium]|nr:MAG: hypothetical protein DCC66_02915 [Planctomycetota bacterium]